MAENTGIPPDLSPVASKPVITVFDGGRLSSDADVPPLAEIARRLGGRDRAGSLRNPGRLPIWGGGGRVR